MTKRILREQYGPIQLRITESAGGVLVAEGEFGYCGEPTKNGRVYTRDIMEREFNRLQPRMESKGLYGVCDHPDDGKTTLKRASHFITSLEVAPDNRVVGQLEVIPGTEGGDTIKAIVEAGGQIGVSSRGVGSVEKGPDGNLIVQEDFRLLAYDAVADPAWGDALPQFNAQGESASHSNQRVEEGPSTSVRGADLESNHTRDTVNATSTSTEDSDMSIDDLDLKELEQKRPDLAEELRNEGREEMADKVEDKTEQLESRVANTLEQTVSRIEQKAESSNFDDEEAGQALQLAEDIKEKVIPMIEDDEIIEAKNQEIDRLSSRIRTLQNAVEQRDRTIENMNRQMLEAKMDSMLAEHLPLVPSDERMKFVRLVGKVEEHDSLEQFEDRLETVVEEFKDTGRYKDAYVDDIAEMHDKIEQYEAELQQARKLVQEGRDLVETLRQDAADLAEAVAHRDELLERAHRQIEESGEVDNRSRQLLEQADQEISDLKQRVEAQEQQIRQQRQLIEEKDELLEEAYRDLQTEDREYEQLQSQLQEARLEAYKNQQVIGARRPNSLLRKLDEAETREDVDSILESVNSERQQEPPSPTPTRTSSNSTRDPVFDESSKQRILERAEGQGPDETDPETQELIEAKRREMRENHEGGSAQSGRAQTGSTQTESQGSDGQVGGVADGGTPSVSSGRVQIPGLSPKELESKI